MHSTSFVCAKIPLDGGASAATLLAIALALPAFVGNAHGPRHSVDAST